MRLKGYLNELLSITKDRSRKERNSNKNQVLQILKFGEPNEDLCAET